MRPEFRLEKNQLIPDEEFVRRWKAFIIKQAGYFCQRWNRPESDFDNFVSAGYWALFCIPVENRWSANYVRTTISNKMLVLVTRNKKCVNVPGIQDDALLYISDGRAAEHMAAVNRKLDAEIILEAAGKDRYLFEPLMRGFSIQEAADHLGARTESYRQRVQKAVIKIRLKLGLSRELPIDGLFRDGSWPKTKEAKRAYSRRHYERTEKAKRKEKREARSQA
jgi:hypothetical protein